MSEPSIPPSHGHLTPSLAGSAYPMAFSAHEVLLNELQNGASAPAPPRQPTAPRRRPPRTSGLYAVVHAAQQHGFTPPTEGCGVLWPTEVDATLALEDKAVAQVVLAVLRQTLGTVVYGPDGQPTATERHGGPGPATAAASHLPDVLWGGRCAGVFSRYCVSTLTASPRVRSGPCSTWTSAGLTRA
jgi:hypothetical protein